MDQLICAEHVSKSFGSNVILNDLNLEIKKGEVAVLIGSSGCGKSTLVRCLSGLEQIQAGRITIQGREIRSVRDASGMVGMVFQNFNLFSHYTVLENIVKPCRTVKKMPKQQAEDLGRELLKKVHLEEKAGQYPSTLSGGQKQRAAIARALAMDPEILIFDEPTSSLDPELAHEVFSAIKELAEEGQTMVIVTHQIKAVRHFATRVIFLNQGKIETQGSPEFMFEQNENQELKRFLRMVDFEDLDG